MRLNYSCNGKKLVYMSHPVGNEYERNLGRALEWWNRLDLRHHETRIFIAPWFMHVYHAHNTKMLPSYKELEGILLDDCMMVEACNELVLLGEDRISTGMLKEALRAAACRMPIYRLKTYADIAEAFDEQRG